MVWGGYERGVMASTKTISKGVRITNEAAEYYQDKPLNRMIEALMELLKAGKVSFDGEDLKITGDSGVHTENSEKSLSATPYDLKDMEEMVGLSGMSMKKFFGDLTEMMENGDFDLSGGKVTVVFPDWAVEFAEACHECSIPVEEAGKKAAKALRKGSI